MEYVLFAAILIATLLLGVWLFFKAVDSESFFSVFSILAFLFWAALLGLLIKSRVEDNAMGPCVQYETQMHYNAATKTMMPARVCVLRGEWVEETK